MAAASTAYPAPSSAYSVPPPSTSCGTTPPTPTAAVAAAIPDRHQASQVRSAASRVRRVTSSSGRLGAGSIGAALVPPMGQRVDADRDRQNERVVLAGRNLHTVGVPDSEPALRHGRDRASLALDVVLVVDHVALGLHLAAAREVDREAVADADERLPDRREGVASPLDRHLVANAELPLLDLGDLVAVRVLEHERLADTQGLAVDAEGPPSLLVL